jgi:hypothetical protein
VNFNRRKGDCKEKIQSAVGEGWENHNIWWKDEYRYEITAALRHIAEEFRSVPYFGVKVALFVQDLLIMLWI